MIKLGIEEVHKHLLSIAKEFDRICTKHDIPYYMVDGTMLGAVRHQGFIPWDDDMDFGVPIEYYEQLEKILLNELSYPYRCCTYKNHPSVLLSYIKIEDMTTVNDNPKIRLPLEKKIGLNIDIFPLNRCNQGDPAINRLRKIDYLLGGAFGNSSVHSSSLFKKIGKIILRLLLGGTPTHLQNKIYEDRLKINEGEHFGFLFSAWGDGDIVPKDWYGKGKRYQFEDTFFVGLEKSDEYLSHVYGDYMTLPPVEKRKPHVENTYLR